MKNWKILIAFGILVLVIGFTIGYLWRAPGEEINSDVISSGVSLAGLEFTSDKIDLMKNSVNENREAYKKIHEQTITNDTFPALTLNPMPVGFQFPDIKKEFKVSPPQHMEVPENLEELAYYSVRDLAYLIQNRKVTSVEITKMFIARLKKYDPELKCVITITEERALEEAKKADEEIAAGKYRGMLHGIPYGVKDLLAAKGYKTTWGAEPYKEQVIDIDSTVVKKLSDAGAVLTAKLTLGALAWGDVWYGGTTKNPWDLKQGSSGSSAGPASAVSAGLLPFAIGSETWGSIVSPSTQCGVTGLRPTYGRVSRTGVMALSWSMDKLGPICRSVEDCAIVFNAIYGPDGIDQTVIDAPFGYTPAVDTKKLRVGYLKSAFDEKENEWKPFDDAALKMLKDMGIELIPIELTDIPVESLSFILNAEGAAAFDELTRSGRDDLMKRQEEMAWPNVFRASRLIPAVEYIQANRLRFKVIQQMGELFKKIDLYVSPSFGGNNLLLTNLTGHPCVVLPNGFDKENHPVSITFIGNLFDEGKLMAFARAYQEATGFHLKKPEKYKP